MEFRNILVELIELADKLNAGFGEKASSKTFLGFWFEQLSGCVVVLLTEMQKFGVNRAEKPGPYQG